MLSDLYNNKIKDDLTKSLEDYEKIFFAANLSQEKIDLLKKFCDSIVLKDNAEKVMIFTTADIYCDRNIMIYKISEKEANWIQEIYFMYEFSDKFQVLFNEGNFGGIFNYVNTGELSLEDAFEALLY